MDIEGFEPDALKGAMALLGLNEGGDVAQGRRIPRSRVLFIVAELNTRQLRDRGVDPGAFLRQISSLGFRISTSGFSASLDASRPRSTAFFLNASSEAQVAALVSRGDRLWTLSLYCVHMRYLEEVMVR
jgi:hypothetical protein